MVLMNDGYEAEMYSYEHEDKLTRFTRNKSEGIRTSEKYPELKTERNKNRCIKLQNS